MRFCIPNKSEWLPIWASVGLVVLLCGPWLTHSSKLYHQVLIVALWLPALIALIARLQVRQFINQPEAYLFIALSIWTYGVLLISGADDVPSAAKVPLYVALSLVGICLSSRQKEGRFEGILLSCAVVGGYFAGFSWIKFYLIDGHTFSQRLVAIGLWDRVILAAHAVSALAVLFFCLAPKWSKPSTFIALLPAVLGYLLFLGFCQTRGVWIALAAGVLMYVVVTPGRWKFAILAAMVLGTAVVWLLNPEVLLQRGLSYRPVIWEKGFDLLMQNWRFGVGFNDFTISGQGLRALVFKHPHNLFLNEGIRLGVFGLLLLVVLWLLVGWRGWRCRQTRLGRATFILWGVGSIALMTDGIGLWKKPYADWFITWLPVALALVLGLRADERIQSRSSPATETSPRSGTSSGL